MDDAITVERGLTKRFRKNLRRPFIEALQEFSMTSPDDRILVLVSPNAQSVLLAKLMQMLAAYSDFPLTVEFCADEPSPVFENLGIPVFEQCGEYDKIAVDDCFDDVCTSTLENIVYNGKAATLPPKSGKTIRPLCYIKRRHIAMWAEFHGLAYESKKSPADALYAELTSEIFDADIRLFRALTTADSRYFLGWMDENGVHHGCEPLEM